MTMRPEQRYPIEPPAGYWGSLRDCPELIGLNVTEPQASELALTALVAGLAHEDNQQAVEELVLGLDSSLGDLRTVFGEDANIAWGEYIYGTALNWYRSLGPTNDLRDGDAPRILLRGMADLLREAACQRDDTHAGMFILAGDMYHEAARLSHGEDYVFNSLCNLAEGCYGQVVLLGFGETAGVRGWTQNIPRHMPLATLRERVAVTGRYHDL